MIGVLFNMMKLEEYIEKRKKEDGLNEFDKNKKDEKNMCKVHFYKLYVRIF